MVERGEQARLAREAGALVDASLPSELTVPVASRTMRYPGTLDVQLVMTVMALDSGTSDLIVDVMPVDARILGFSNRWYPAAIETAQTFDVAGHDVRVVTPALFIAAKLVAFHGRGGNDIFSTTSFEPSTVR